MKVLVTGVSGQLGHDVMNELDKRGYTGITVVFRIIVLLQQWNMSRWT